MKRLVLILILTSIFRGLFCQGKNYLFTNIDKSQGLSNNHIQTFLRDNKGFIWIGTWEGLCRFDGYSFKVFKTNINDSNSIRDNIINDLFEDNNGNIWIAAGDYMEIFDPETEVFSHSQTLFNKRVDVPVRSRWYCTYDQNKNIIYANDKDGIYKYIVSSDSLFKIHFPHIDTSKTVSYINIDKNGNLWVACTNSYLYKLHRDNYLITDSVKLVKKLHNLYRFFIDNDNDIWIFDKDNASGIIYYNTQENKVSYFNTESEKCRLNNNSVTGVIQDESGLIWIAADHGGINIIDKRDFSIRYVLNNPFNERSLVDNAITCIYKDYQNFVWVGSYKKGVSYYHENLFNFNLYKIRLDNASTYGYNDIDNFAEDSKGNLWIGTNGGGLIYFDRVNNSFRQYIHDPENPNSLSANIIVGMLMDSDNRLWAGTYFGGLNIYQNGRFQHLRNVPGDPTTISDDRIWDICEDSEGTIWIGTLLGGVDVIDPVTKKVTEQFLEEGDSSIGSDHVFSVIEDRDSLMWFATIYGLRSYDKKTKKFRYFEHDEKNPNSLSNNFVYDVYEDSRGFIWAGTTDGLNMYDKKTNSFKIFRQEEGLPSNTILTIIEDNNRNLWMSTTNGLSNLVVTEGRTSGTYNFRFKNYDVNDGLQGNEFNQKAVFKTSSGELLFGGPNGFNLFDPDDIKAININSDIVFTDFQIFNKSITSEDIINGKKILTGSITFTDTITLSYKENVFTIEFADLNFLHPERRLYNYKLENFNKEWLLTDGRNRKATYTNLDPGTYIFRVKTTNTDGTWVNKEALLTINIMPPWWQTLVFKILILVAVISLSALFYYNLKMRWKKQQKVLENEVNKRTYELSEAYTLLEKRQKEISTQNKELETHRNRLEELVTERTAELEKALLKAEESDRLKSAFLANMSHEIRTPLNAIVGFSSLLKNENITKKQIQEYIDTINTNSDSLLILINDILDLSRIEADQLIINKSAFNVNKILEELENYYNLGNDNAISITFINKDNKKKLLIYNDPVRFKQVLSNLLDNAKKYTEKGFIRFGYNLKPGNVEFFVSDSGIGIKKSDFDKVFNHFYKIENNGIKIYRGTGLGLAICKRLVNLMGGEIWLESEEEKGTTFYFNLSLATPEHDKKKIITSGKPHKTLKNHKRMEIIVAEDEPDNFSLIKSILRKYHVSVLWAKNGKEAVEYVRSSINTGNMLVIMDIKMPVMNGIDALKEIRKFDSNIPVIAVTAYAHQDEKYEILKNSFNDYIIKPIRPEMLIDSIEKVIYGNNKPLFN
jgi:signal transduction histidine kinase/ligand-binding sensor domain-containing protein/CheY-like chemotaxis protein